MHTLRQSRQLVAGAASTAAHPVLHELSADRVVADPLADLEGRLDRIAVACHASTALIERASDGNAAYLRFDIKCREVLTAQVGSPLVDVIDPATPATDRPTPAVPTALDLPDVDVPTITLPAQPKKAAGSANGSKPAASSSTPEDDVSDWI